MDSERYNAPIPPNGATSEWQAPDAEPAGTQGAVYSSRASQTPSPQDAKKKSGGGFKSFLTGFLGGVVALVIAFCLANYTPVLNGFKSGGTVTSNNGSITIDAKGDNIELAEAVAAKDIDSVVTVYVYTDTTNQFFGTSSSSNTPSGLGSGVIISSENGECYILTNYHVLEGASRATVKTSSAEYEAEIVGSDSKTDLAVVKIKADGLTAIEWGDSSEVAVGEWVMAIGSPYGYEQTVTTGIVSAMYRSDVLTGASGSSSTVYTDMIQTDAAINPGNSGGALVDADGKLIGINTYISSTSQSSAGLGFAIPVSTAKRVADQIMAGKTVTHSFLGITMSSSTDPAGAQVTSVYKDTAAANAGLQTGDVITKVDGKAVTSPNDVSIAVTSKNAGDTMEITYVRNGSEKTTTATLGSDDVSTNEYAENGAPANQYGNNGYGYSYPYGNSGNGGNGYGFGLGDLFGFGYGN